MSFLFLLLAVFAYYEYYYDEAKGKGIFLFLWRAYRRANGFFPVTWAFAVDMGFRCSHSAPKARRSTAEPDRRSLWSRSTAKGHPQQNSVPRACRSARIVDRGIRCRPLLQQKATIHSKTSHCAPTGALHSFSSSYFHVHIMYSYSA
jgi:hypothetical protein